MINIYHEMGFSPVLSKRAENLFGIDNIAEASEWLLRHSTLGSMPKRFKEGKASGFQYTFYKSKISLNENIFLISDYNEKFQIIEIEPYSNSNTDPRWISLSDPAITWLRESHNSKPTYETRQSEQLHELGPIHLPVEAAFRGYGEDDLTYETFLNEFQEETPNGLGRLWNMFGTARVFMAQNVELARYWDSLLTFTNKYDMAFAIKPLRPMPKVISERTIRHVRTRAWSKIVLLLEIVGLEKEHTVQMLHNCTIASGKTTLQRLKHMHDIDDDVINELTNLYCIYRRPARHLNKTMLKWQSECKSAFSIKNGKVVDGVFTGMLYMDNDFIKEAISPESKYWVHLSNMFDMVKWGESFATNTQVCLGSHAESILTNREDLYITFSMKQWGQKILEWCKNSSDPLNMRWPEHTMNHQKQAISWMYNKEISTFDDVKPCWEPIGLRSGFKFYKHVFGNIIPNMNNLQVHQDGGIIAQSNGSGKTFSIIQLIEKMKAMDKWQKVDNNKLTLIVVQSKQLYFWKSEFSKWNSNLSLKIYHSTKRNLNNLKMLMLY